MNDQAQEAGLGVPYQPAGRPLIPNQDCTPHKGKDFRPWEALIWAAGLVSIAAALVMALKL